MDKVLEVKAKLEEHNFKNIKPGYVQTNDYLLKCFSKHQNVDKVFGEDLDALNLEPGDRVLFTSVFFEVAHQLASEGKEQVMFNLSLIDVNSER